MNCKNKINNSDYFKSSDKWGAIQNSLGGSAIINPSIHDLINGDSNQPPTAQSGHLFIIKTRIQKIIIIN